MASSKKKKQQELIDQIIAGEYTAPVVKQITEGRERATKSNNKTSDIAPVKNSTNNEIAPTKKEDNWATSLLKNTVKKSGYFDDGYQFGDITKTIGSTVGHIGSSIIEGGYSAVEGLTDLQKQATALSSDISGAITKKIIGGYLKSKTSMNDEAVDTLSGMASNIVTQESIKASTNQKYSSADELRKSAIENDWDNSIAGDIQERLKEGSVAGETTDKLANLVGYTGSLALGGGALGSAGNVSVKVGNAVLNMPTLAITTATAQSLNEGYSSNPDASNVAQWSRALTSGLVEGATEGLFGFMGIGGSSLDDLTAKAVSKMADGMAKKLTSLGIQMTGESLEELIGYAGNQLTDLVVDKTTGNTNFHNEWDWAEVGENMVLAFVSTGLSAGGTSALNSIQTNIDINKTANNAIKESEAQLGRKLTAEEKKSVKEQIKAQYSAQTEEITPMQQAEQLEAQLEEKQTELSQVEDRREQEIIQDEINAIQDELTPIQQTQKQIDLKQKAFTYEATENDSDFRKGVYESASQVMNDTEASHKLADAVAKISEEKQTSYKFVNNKTLKELGYNVEGKTVNGLVNENGEVLINIDSAKALDKIVGHETTHLLEGTKEYEDLKQIAIKFAKTNGDYQSRIDNLNSLYEGKNADIEAELTSDIVGDYLFTNEQFLQELSVQKPTIFQKIKNLISDLVVKFKGTEQEKQLRELQRKFEKAYQTNNTQENTDIKYSLSEDGKMIDNSTNKEVKLEATETGNHKSLMAIHNLNESKLNGILDLGGLPSPSIAILDTDKMGHTEFGDISLVFDSSTIDPSNKKNEVYDRDVWSPTFPKVDYDINNDAIQSIIDENNIYYNYRDNIASIALNRYFDASNLGDLVDRYGLEGTLKTLKESKELKYLYLQTINNGQYQTATKTAQFSNSYSNESLQRFLDNYKNEIPLNELSYEQTIELAEQVKEAVTPEVEKNNEVWKQVLQEQGKSYKEIDTVVQRLIKENLDTLNNYNKLNNFIYDAFTYQRALKENKLTIIDEKTTLENVLKDIDQKEYEKWIDDTFGTMFSNTKKGIRNNKDLFTPSGNRRSFNQLHEEYNLQNIVKQMISQSTKGGQKTLFEGGFGKTSAQLATRFNSIEEIRNAKDKMMTREEASEIIEPMASQLSDDIKELVPYHKQSSYNSDVVSVMEAFEHISEAVEEFAGKSSLTIDNFRKVLDSWYSFNTDKIPNEKLQKIIDDLNLIKDLPTDYFEAKPQRAVGLDEVQAVVIPNNASDNIKQRLSDNGLNVIEYDPNIEGDRQAKINELEQYKFSLSNEGEQDTAPVGNFYSEDVKLQVEEAIAPLQETINNLTEQIQNIVPVTEQQAPVQELQTDTPTQAEIENLFEIKKNKSGSEYASAFFELRNKYGQAKLYKAINEYNSTGTVTTTDENIAPAKQEIVEAQNTEAFNNITENDIPPSFDNLGGVFDEIGETEVTPTIPSPLEGRNIEDVGNRKVKAYQYENPEVRPYFQEEAQNMLYDLENTIKGEKIAIKDEAGYITDWAGITRQTTEAIAYLKDTYGYSYAEIEKGLNNIIKDDGAENNAVSKRIEFLLDERLREGYTTSDGIPIPPNENYIKFLEEKQITEYNLENFNAISDADIPETNENTVLSKENTQEVKGLAPTIKVAENQNIEPEKSLSIAPSKKGKYSGQYQMKKVTENETLTDSVEQAKLEEFKKIAEVLTERPTAENRKQRLIMKARASFLDKGSVFEDLSLKTKNRELMAKWDNTMLANAKAQYAIGKGIQASNTNTKTMETKSKSLDSIRETVVNSGKIQDFSNYMYHLLNTDRMTLDTRMEEDNKPVFGEDVSAEQSRQIAQELENNNPEFAEWANDIYEYNRALRDVLVENNVISQETADYFEEKYPHYVPIQRVDVNGNAINVPLDTNRTGVNTPIKKATGGNTDIMPLFDTLANRTFQTYRASAKNSFGVELKNTLQSQSQKELASLENILDSVDDQDSLLQEGKNGKAPTFTVFENGEKVTYEITQDMYDALKPISDSSFLSTTIRPLNLASSFHRGVLTQYNPLFSLTNAMKDAQDVLINSQHPAKTYAKFGESYAQILNKGYWYQEYMSNGGEQNSYFDSQDGFDVKPKGVEKITEFLPLKAISAINDVIETAPRLAEYIASREAGRSIETSMLDASRVTTNFKAGGDVTKWANRNGFTFLNASVQGLNQNIRNIREAHSQGLKGYMNLALKFAIAGAPALLLNGLMWDDDDDYEELSDYVKQNYYVIGKKEDGTFIRIPKGRMSAVLQEGANQIKNFITGDDEVDLNSFLELALNNLAPNNPIENNVFAPIAQVKANQTWYGEDLVPSRLQDEPVEQQYDESTDKFSIWLGQTLGVSPYKINYLLDQYSGGIGDVLLPMGTTQAETPTTDNILSKISAPFVSKFTTNSTLNNQNISDFYKTSEELTSNANSVEATDEDELKNKYINSIKSEMNELYKEKREIQSDETLSDTEKYNRVLEVQDQINEMAKKGLSSYENIKKTDTYARIGDKEYYKKTDKDGEAEWKKVEAEELSELNDLQMDLEDKTTYFELKSEISEIKNSEAEDKKNQIATLVKETSLTDEQKAYIYGKNYSSDEMLSMIIDSNIPFNEYLSYASQTFTADKDENGKSISGSRRDKIISYVNSLNLDIPQKAMLIRSEYSTFKDYNNDIVEYVDSLNIDYSQKRAILEELKFTVNDDGSISW